LTLQTAGRPRRPCGHFAAREGALWSPPARAWRWAPPPQGVPPAQGATRLGMVRGLAPDCRALAVRTAGPPPGLFPYRSRRPPPDLSRAPELTPLRPAARPLPSVPGLRPSPYAPLRGVRAVTGRRRSEALPLDGPAVEGTPGSRTMRQTQVGKPRCLPLPPSTRAVLHPYARCRAQLGPRPSTGRFVLSQRGTPLPVGRVQRTCGQVSRPSGLRAAPARAGPRLQALRPRFAVRPLRHWERPGAAGEQRLPPLSASLGQAPVHATVW